MGLIFTKGDLQEVGAELGKYKVGASMRITAYFLLHCRLLIQYREREPTSKHEIHQKLRRIYGNK